MCNERLKLTGFGGSVQLIKNLMKYLPHPNLGKAPKKLVTHHPSIHQSPIAKKKRIKPMIRIPKKKTHTHKRKFKFRIPCLIIEISLSAFEVRHRCPSESIRRDEILSARPEHDPHKELTGTDLVRVDENAPGQKKGEKKKKET